MPGGSRLKTVAIVGGGFSGTTLAATLLERSEAPIRVLLFDRSGAFGAGLAYGTDEACHLLNVPAGNMSAFADRPGHFTDWIALNGISVGDGFAARRDYRRYLGELLGRPFRHHDSSLEKISEAVVGLEDGFRLRTAERFFDADKVVLATGYLPETSSGQAEALAPFEPSSWPLVGVQEVILIGSSLTALDAAASVFARYPGARVTCVSRHGIVPEPFRFSPPRPLSSPPPAASVRSILKWLRQEIAEAGDWAPVFDTMRPRWEAVWQGLPESEKRRFVRHLARRFDSYRHRVPPALSEFLAPFWASGALSVRVSRETVFSADLVLDCSGSCGDWTRSGDPLLRDLLGRVRLGSLGMGIEADEEGRVRPGLFALGPLLRGSRWETTAVPEIRGQVATVCEAILRDSSSACQS